MPSIPENIILKSFQDTITDEEAKILNHWLKEKKKNVEYYCQLEEIWNSNKSLSEETIRSGWNRLLTDIEKGASQKRIDITSRKQKPLLWLRYIAVIFIGGLIASALWYNYYSFKKEEQEKQVLVQNVLHNRSGVQPIVFPDSSRTWINGSGKVTWPDRFDNNQRVVLLEGKAYFDIKKDTNAPFIVRNENIDIEVTGTELFADFTSGDLMKVVLISGSVSVHCKNENGKESISSLIPGQQADINRTTGEIVVTTTDVDYYVAWKDGTYRFKNVQLKKIAALVSRYYNVDIQVAPTLKDKRFTGRITPDDDITDVMEIISKSFPVQYKVAGKKVTIKPI